MKTTRLIQIIALNLLIILNSTLSAENRENVPYKIPILVTITSNYKTWISVVGPTEVPPHKITKSTFVFGPGEYTIVARRKGYEDIRTKITLIEGKTQDPLRIVCKKKSESVSKNRKVENE